MALDTTSLRSRRALLAGTVGGLAALAAGAFGRAQPVSATHAGDVLLGHDNPALDTTQIRNTERDGSAFFGVGSGLGTGVYGQSDSGSGVHAVSATGIALQASGRVAFSTSGLATIPAGQTSVVVTPGVDVTPGSFVLLTPKANLAGRDLWFATNATADSFTIRMSASRSKATKAAWLLVG